MAVASEAILGGKLPDGPYSEVISDTDDVHQLIALCASGEARSFEALMELYEEFQRSQEESCGEMEF